MACLVSSEGFGDAFSNTAVAGSNCARHSFLGLRMPLLERWAAMPLLSRRATPCVCSLPPSSSFSPPPRQATPPSTEPVERRQGQCLGWLSIVQYCRLNFILRRKCFFDDIGKITKISNYYLFSPKLFIGEYFFRFFRVYIFYLL